MSHSCIVAFAAKYQLQRKLLLEEKNVVGTAFENCYVIKLDLQNKELCTMQRIEHCSQTTSTSSKSKVASKN